MSRSLLVLAPQLAVSALPRTQRSGPRELGARVAAPCSVALVFTLLLAAPGCDRAGLVPGAPVPSTSAGSPPAAGAGGAPVAPPAGVAAVLDVPLTPDGRATLAAWARDPALASELRLASLRRLEELAAPDALTVAGELAAATQDALLGPSAVAVLVRLDAGRSTPETRAALAALSPEGRALAAALARGEGSR